MKKQITLVITLSMVAASLSAAALFSINRELDKADAYTSESSLPTTIDLNDTSAANIRSYYSSLNALSASEKSGNNLLKNLKSILMNGQKYYSYDYYTSPNYIWQIYEISDRDWTLSPASSTTYGTYNPSTNKITNYVYGTSSSYGRNNPYIHALYINRDATNETRAWGSHEIEAEWGLNREHVWAKSHGMNSKDTTSESAGARGDPMHLIAGNGPVNEMHSNYFYGFVNKNSSYTDMGSTYSQFAGNLTGYSLNKGGSTTVFEPQDCDKGDIARAIFYMAARYNSLDGDTNIDANNPNLVILDATSDPNGSSSYDCDSTKAGYMGILRDLLAWNRLDPPDEYEIHRNNLLYTNYTNNRNPFIDYPEWAEYIWGKVELANDNRTITSYSSTATGSANPNSDTINAFSVAGDVAVTGVSLSPSNAPLTVGQTVQLTATVSPSNATNKNVSYSSNNTSVASVDSSGKVTANSVGNATVTVTTQDGGFTATSTISVSEAPTSSYSLTSGSPYINGVPYNMFFHSNNDSKDYYFSGTMSGYYGATTTTSVGVNVYFEDANGGQYTYFMDGTTKKYISLEKPDSYVNFTISESTPTYKWTYEITEDDGALLMCTIESNRYCFGTYGSKTTIGNINLDSYSVATNPNEYPIQFISNDNTSATALAELFTTDIICDASGSSAPGYKSGITWSSFESAYAFLNSDAKALLKNTDSSTTGSSLQKGLAKYDYILGKYNTSSTTPYNDFLGRIEAGKIVLHSPRMILDIRNNNLLLIMVIVSFAFIASIGVFFIILNKRKRHI